MKQHTIAIINQKGGVGKTTTSINLGHGIAMLGKRVLLIDLDPQAHSTIVLSIDKDFCSGTIEDVLLHRRDIHHIITKTCIDNLDLAPSGIDLDKTEQLLVPEMFRETRLSKALFGLDYEFIIIDCRPTLGILSINALYASNAVLIPCEMSRFSLEGFADLLNTIKILKKDEYDNNQCDMRILLCKFDSRKAIGNEWTLKQLEPYRTLLLKTRIRQCEGLNQAHMAKESIFTFKPKSHGAKDYMDLAKELIGT